MDVKDQTFGERLKDAREEAHLRVVDFLAIAPWASRQSLHGWENDLHMPSWPAYLELCQIFGWEPDYGDYLRYVRRTRVYLIAHRSPSLVA